MSTRISFTLLHILCNQNVCCLFNISVRLIVLNISCAFIEVLMEWIFICVVNLYRSHNLSIINFWCDIKTVIQVYISTECLLHRLCNTQILVWSRSYIRALLCYISVVFFGRFIPATHFYSPWFMTISCSNVRNNNINNNKLKYMHYDKSCWTRRVVITDN